LNEQGKPNNRRARIKKRIAKIYASQANHRKHFSHLQSRRIADNYDAVVIESHSLKGLMMGQFAKGVADVGHGHFRACLTYKLADRGKKLIETKQFFKSTGICPDCGHDMGRLSLNVRKWTCPICKREHDRDIAAARIIQLEGQKQLTADLV
jgi:putative transposase